MKEQIQQPQIDLKTTTVVLNKKGTPVILREGVILRNVSKFLIGSSKNGMVPIPVFIDVDNKILLDTLPEDIKQDYLDVGFSLEN